MLSAEPYTDGAEQPESPCRLGSDEDFSALLHFIIIFLSDFILTACSLFSNKACLLVINKRTQREKKKQETCVCVCV